MSERSPTRCTGFEEEVDASEGEKPAPEDEVVGGIVREKDDPAYGA